MGLNHQYGNETDQNVLKCYGSWL